MEAARGRLDVRVHSKDEESVRERAVPPSASAGWRSAARERTFARDASRSAAATLDLYLADALQDSGRRSPLRDRLGTRDIATRGDVRCRVGGADLVEHSAPLDPDRPESPLSRFLKASRPNGGLSMRLLRDHNTTSRQLTEERNRIGRSTRFDFIGGSTGSMERLLREKINEAKSLRGHPKGQLEQENRQPNAAEISSAVRGHHSTLDFNASEAATKVPVPHAMPVRPTVLLPTREIYGMEEASRYDNISPMNQSARDSELMRAARRIQRLWRRWLQNQRAHRPLRLIEYPPMFVANPDPESVERQSDVVTVEEADKCGLSSESFLHMAFDVVDEETRGLQTITVEIPDEFCTIPMWQDEDWRFLEEGQYSIPGLLDPPAVVEENLDILVRDKPHLVIEMQEARRRNQERARRWSRHQNREEGTRQVTPRNRPRVPKLVLVRSYPTSLPSRKRSSHPRADPRPGTLRKQRKHFRIKIATYRRPLAPNKNDRVPAHDQHQLPEESISEHNSKVAIQCLQPQRSRCAEFSNLEVYDCNSLASCRNNIIAIKDRAPSIASDTLGAAYSSTASQIERNMSIADDSDDDDRSDSVQVAELESCHPSTDKAMMLQPSTTVQASPSETAVLLASKTVGRPAHLTDVFHDTELLFPALRQVELEVQRTLVRIQAQYTRDQQALIDAYTNDAYFSTFLSPSNTIERPPSPRVHPADASAQELSRSPKQHEFLEALDAFRQSLRSTSSARSVDESGGLELGGCESPDEGSCSSVGDVDAELQAMLDEIQRCKRQIAAARRS